MNNDVNGFLRAQGTKLVNEAGEEVLLRGVGFGSWMLPEGYMWRFPAAGDRPRRIERMIKELIGEEKARQFWKIYYERYITEADIRQIAAEGFNSVRLPLHWRVLMEEEHEQPVFKQSGLHMLDQVIEWCKHYKLYVVLDLHGAPGGQTGANIDDSGQDLPELFTNEQNRVKTVALWRMLAARYKDEPIVAGYDLLNEPLPNWFAQYNALVMPLYVEIIEAIREVDQRHMIILEGVHWATDWSIFQKKPDENIILQFHKYWNNPDTESIQQFIDKRAEWNVPIYMGEGGENNKAWYTGAFRLFEDHDISWNFWTWKKMDTDNSPVSINKPRDWQLLVNYLEGGNKPDEQTADRILWEYLHNLAFEQCTYHADVVRSLLRKAPVTIPAIFYGYRGEGSSYGITQRAEQHIGFRVNDGVAMQFIEGERSSANFQHGGGELWQPDERIYVQLHPENWLSYDWNAAMTDNESDGFAVGLRLYAPGDSAGSIEVAVDGEVIGEVAAPCEKWETVQLSAPLSLQPGLHSLTVKAKHHTVRIEWLEIMEGGTI